MAGDRTTITPPRPVLAPQTPEQLRLASAPLAPPGQGWSLLHGVPLPASPPQQQQQQQPEHPHHPAAVSATSALINAEAARFVQEATKFVQQLKSEGDVQQPAQRPPPSGCARAPGVSGGSPAPPAVIPGSRSPLPPAPGGFCAAPIPAPPSAQPLAAEAAAAPPPPPAQRHTAPPPAEMKRGASYNVHGWPPSAAEQPSSPRVFAEVPDGDGCITCPWRPDERIKVRVAGAWDPPPPPPAPLPQPSRRNNAWAGVSRVSNERPDRPAPYQRAAAPQPGQLATPPRPEQRAGGTHPAPVAAPSRPPAAAAFIPASGHPLPAAAESCAHALQRSLFKDPPPPPPSPLLCSPQIGHVADVRIPEATGNLLRHVERLREQAARLCNSSKANGNGQGSDTLAPTQQGELTADPLQQQLDKVLAASKHLHRQHDKLRHEREEERVKSTKAIEQLRHQLITERAGTQQLVHELCRQVEAAQSSGGAPPTRQGSVESNASLSDFRILDTNVSEEDMKKMTPVEFYAKYGRWDEFEKARDDTRNQAWFGSEGDGRL